MIVDMMEVFALGGYVGNKDLRASIPIEIFSDEIRSIFEGPAEAMEKRMRDWLQTKGVQWVKSETPMEATVRTLKANNDRREQYKRLRDGVRSFKARDFGSVTALRELTDKLLPHCDPKPE